MAYKKGHKLNAGKIPWNKGWKGLQVAWNRGLTLSDAHKINLRKNHKGMSGRAMSIEHKRNIGLANKKNVGRIPTVEHRRKLSVAQKKRVLEGTHNLYKGGVSPINKIIRGSLEYKLWRESVFKRDNYTCVWCGKRGVELNADHIKPFAFYPELRFAIDNGRTLCVPCHKTTETYTNNKKI